MSFLDGFKKGFLDGMSDAQKKDNNTTHQIQKKEELERNQNSYIRSREKLLEAAAKNRTFPPTQYWAPMLGTLEVDRNGQLILKNVTKTLIDVPISQVENVLISDTGGGILLNSNGVITVVGSGTNLYSIPLAWDLNAELKSPVKALSHDLTYWKNTIKKLDQRNLESKSSPTAPASSNADEIRKLSTLFNEGVLTAEEFAAAKKKLLGL